LKLRLTQGSIEDKEELLKKDMKAVVRELNEHVGEMAKNGMLLR